jgi:hypothetical protein
MPLNGDFYEYGYNELNLRIFLFAYFKSMIFRAFLKIILFFIFNVLAFFLQK